MSKMNRRKFLKDSILGSTLVGMAPALLHTTIERAQANPPSTDFPWSFPLPMERRLLPKPWK